jgi:hypothetical protein
VMGKLCRDIDPPPAGSIATFVGATVNRIATRKPAPICARVGNGRSLT